MDYLHISTIDPNSSGCNPLQRTYSSSMVHHMGTLGRVGHHHHQQHPGSLAIGSRTSHGIGATTMHPGAFQMPPQPNHIYSTMTRVPRHLIPVPANSLQPLVQPMTLPMHQQVSQQKQQQQQQQQPQSNLGSLVPMVSY